MHHRHHWLPLLLLLVATSGTAFGQTFLTGTFTADQQTGDVTSDATGTAALALTDDGVRFLITVDGLSGPITAAHFHRGATGTDGGVVRTITDDFTGTTARGLWTATDAEPLTDDLIEALLAGELYLNIHTAANPPGEVRAQLYPSSGDVLTAYLTPDQETGDVTSDGAGTAVVQTTEAGVLFWLTVDGLSGPITAAHFHRGATGTDGGVVRTITDDFTGNTAFGLWTATDAEPLTSELYEALLLDELYFNLHTAAHPPGEVRGQVRLTSGWGLTASLEPDQETHDVTSDATGTAALTLTDGGVRFLITVDGLSGPITAAHFHRGATGTDGGVVRTLTGDFTGTTARGLWTADDAEPLTDDLIEALLAGELYLNIHTAANPPGEIRGQVLLSEGTPLAAALTTAQETHDVTGNGGGTASLQLTDEGLRFAVTVDSLSGPITAAHFHRGATGTDGGVVRTLTGDFTGTTARGLWTATDAEPLTDELIEALLLGELYLNIHTAANPPGEIRGQVELAGGTPLAARLTADQQTGDVTSDASGTAAVTLTGAGAAFSVTVDGLSGPITAAHFHRGATGTDGGVVRTITDAFTGNTASGLWTATDAEPLTDELVEALLLGELYLNIHTAANPPGEIRGQVVLRGVTGAAANLDPEQETHDVTSDASGTAAVTLTAAGMVFQTTITALSGPITAAHFHNAPAGTDGGVVRTITDDFTGNTARGLWSADDAEPLTPDLLRAFTAGELYLNIHTAANPPGEARGQLRAGAVVVTAIERQEGPVPATYGLAQNYPNPFRAATTLAFDVPRPGPVRLDVFNLLGRRVATLIDGALPPGRYAVTFAPRSLPAGVYFYRLEAGGLVQTRRMVLLP